MFTRKLLFVLAIVFSAKVTYGADIPIGTGYNVPNLAVLHTKRMWEANPRLTQNPHYRALDRLNDKYAKKILYDLRAQRASHVRVGVTWYNETHIADWVNLQTRPWYWQQMDRMVSGLRAANVPLVPVFDWYHEQFPRLVGETACDMITKRDSQARALFAEYVTEFVERYHNTGAIAFYELANELNLQADLPWAWTTEELIEFSRWGVALIKNAAPDALVSSGYGMPNFNALQLRRKKEGRDTLLDLEEIFKIIHEPYDMASVHFYNHPNPLDPEFIPDNERFGYRGAELLAEFKRWAQDIGKTLYVGEFGDVRPEHRNGKRMDAFSMQVICELERIKVVGTIWAYQFHQFEPGVPVDLSIEPGRGPVLRSLSSYNVFARSLRSELVMEEDRQSPQVIIAWPLNGGYVENFLDEIRVSASDALRENDFNISSLEVWIDNIRLVTITRPPYQCRLIPLLYSASLYLTGKRTLKVVAKAEDGRWATDEVMVTILPQAYMPPTGPEVFLPPTW